MTITRRFKVGCLMTLLIGFGIGIGFIFGILAHQSWKKKTEEPVFMKWAAMKNIDKLDPTPEQKQKLETIVDRAITELIDFKAQALTHIWDIIDRTENEIEAELTPEQKTEWADIKPKRPVEIK